jgi:hypothetical protein
MREFLIRVIRSASFSLRQEIKVLCSVFRLAAQASVGFFASKTSQQGYCSKTAAIDLCYQIDGGAVATCKSHTSHHTEILAPVGIQFPITEN